MVVANIQVRTLKAEVEKGFVRTAVDHESVDPEAKINLVNSGNRASSGVHFRLPFGRKGIRVNIPEPGSGYLYGNVTELRDGGRCPGKSSLFFLTHQMTLESLCAEIGLDMWQSTSFFGVSGA